MQEQKINVKDEEKTTVKTKPTGTKNQEKRKNDLLKGELPVKSSYSSTPKDHQSADS